MSGWQEPEDGFEDLLDRRESDSREGWEKLQQMLSEDEAWAQAQFEAFHGREY